MPKGPRANQIKIDLKSEKNSIGSYQKPHHGEYQYTLSFINALFRKT